MLRRIFTDVFSHAGKRITLKDIHNLASKSCGQNDLTSITESLSSCTGLFYSINDVLQLYRVRHKVIVSVIIVVLES